LDGKLRMKAAPRLRFAEQITGVEGYVESAAMGLLAGRLAATERKGGTISLPPETTAHGELVSHITGGHLSDGKHGHFQPMNVNFGLFPPLEEKRVEYERNGKVKKRKMKRAERRTAMAHRGLADLKTWLA